MRSQSSRAFTLIELIFVVVILGIIAAVILPKLGEVGRDAQAKQRAESFQATPQPPNPKEGTTWE